MPQGEIFFTVAPDVQRPFVVKVAEGYISAVGTAFAVRLNAGAPSVVVREGIVAVKREADAEATRVRAGQQLEMVRNGGLAVRPVDIKTELAWTRRLVNFSGQTIGEAVRTFNRHNKLQIEIADARIAGEILNLGEFYLDDPEWFVTTLNARVERAGPHTLRLLIRDRHGEGE
jgi:transmembrane sensor